MNGHAEMWQSLHTLPSDFLAGFSAMLHRCPPMQLIFMTAWIFSCTGTVSSAFLYSIFFLVSMLAATLVAVHSGNPFYSSFNVLIAKNLTFIHLTAGVITFAAAWQFLGIRAAPWMNIKNSKTKICLLTLFWGVYFAVLENVTCTVCPLFFERINYEASVHPSHFSQETTLRILSYTSGHAGFALMPALALVLLFNAEKLDVWKSSASVVFALALFLIGLFFLLIA